jgi:hypothetical protein
LVIVELLNVRVMVNVTIKAGINPRTACEEANLHHWVVA